MTQLLHASKEQMQSWRRHLHQHPETEFSVFDTAAFVVQKLTEFGLVVHEGVGQIGIVGQLTKGSSNKAIGLRADMDALAIQELNEFPHKSLNDGRMHACGHDGHTTMLLGAARYLAETKNFDGTIYFIFQPAEENEAGGRVMVQEGLFDQFPCDDVYGMHNMPGIPVGQIALMPGPMMASADSTDSASNTPIPCVPSNSLIMTGAPPTRLMAGSTSFLSRTNVVFGMPIWCRLRICRLRSLSREFEIPADVFAQKTSICSN